MHQLRQAVQYLWPELMISGTSWYKDWDRDNKSGFANRAKIFFFLATLSYLGHYYFVDIPNNKEPIEAWFLFRMVMAALSFACFAFYLLPNCSKYSWVRWPAILIMTAGCHTQAHVAIYFPDAPWIYPYIFVFSCVLILGSSPLKSLLFAFPLMVSFFPPLTTAGIPEYQLASASVVCTIVIFVVRSAYISDIRNYLLTQERDESRREVISLGKEYEGRLKSFIPRVIAERIQNQIDYKKKTVLEATVEVLSAKKRSVACLWSDIRGFTEGSRDIDSFLIDSVMPEIKACTDAIEDYQGIPRKIGDLVFAYFDDVEEDMNVLRAVLAGFSLSDLNADMNATVSSITVKRYILVSSGEAVVGNVGGLNSGVEITALGPPVNFLARLDDATKQPGLASQLEPGDLLLCEHSAARLKNMSLGRVLEEIDLRAASVEIRDFPEVSSVFIIRPSEANKNLILSILRQVVSAEQLRQAS